MDSETKIILIKSNPSPTIKNALELKVNKIDDASAPMPERAMYPIIALQDRQMMPKDMPTRLKMLEGRLESEI